jgi:predicted membrane-bound spermidine synthase
MALHRGAMFAVSFYAGLGTMAFEMVLGRALVPYFGGTIYTWGALIAVFLLGMSFGFFTGGRLADRYPRIGLVAGLLAACGVVILCTPLYAEPLCLALLEGIEDVRVGALIASLAMAFLPALLFAAVSPVAVRLALIDVAHSGSTVGAMSGLNTVGSIVGTIGTSFFLVPVIGSRAIFYVLGALTIACAAALFALRRGAPALALIATLFLAPTAPVEAQVSVMAPDGVIEKVESEYNNVFVIKQGQTLYMNFGYRSSQYVESVFDMLDRGALAAPYTRYMTIAPAYLERFERAAFVGLGGGRTASYLVDSFPQLAMEIAELDPEVIRLAKKYFGVKESERLKIHAQDGRIFLTRAKGTYDAVFLDAYRGPFVPFHLLTREYFQIIKRHLRPGGVVAQNVEPTTMVLDSAIRTIGTVFRNVDTYEAGGNVVIIAYDGEPIPPARLRQRAAALTKQHKLRYDLVELLGAKREIKPQAGAKLLTDDFAPVEMLKTIKRHNERRS